MKRVSKYSTETNVIEAIFQKQRNNSIAMSSLKKYQKATTSTTSAKNTVLSSHQTHHRNIFL